MVTASRTGLQEMTARARACLEKMGRVAMEDLDPTVCSSPCEEE